MNKNFNVWPSVLYQWVSDFISDISKEELLITPHRSPKFSEIYKDTEKAFKNLWDIPDNYKLFFTYSATDAMDVVLSWIVDNEIYHTDNWTFGKLFINASKYLWKNVKVLEKDGRYTFPAKNIIWNPEVLAITANDTSTWMNYNQDELSLIRENNKDSLIVIDATSSFGALQYDIKNADAWIFSVQKCLGLPSGLWIALVNEKIIEKARFRKSECKFIWGHNSLINLDEFYNKWFTVSTPNTLLILALSFVSKKLKEDFQTAKMIDLFTKVKAKTFYSQIKNIDWIEPYCLDQNNLSKTTFVLKVTKEKLLDINMKKEELWFSISPGLFDLEWEVIRIANFPAISESDLEKLVDNVLR